MHITHVKSVNCIAPILVRHAEGEDPIVVVYIRANEEEYLTAQNDSEAVEEKKGFQPIETIWTFQPAAGKWLLHQSEEKASLSVYLRLSKEAFSVS